MKRSNGIELIKFSIEKVWEMILKMCGDPVTKKSDASKKRIFHFFRCCTYFR